MRAPFVVEIRAQDAAYARAVADALAQELPASPEPDDAARVQAGDRTFPGAVAIVGVPSAGGRMRWTQPVPLEGDVQAGTRAVLAFLERWGFIPASTRAPPPRA